MSIRCFHLSICATITCLLIGMTAMAAPPSAAVATPDRYSADAARAILLAGGNAADAAVATAFVLAVTRPDAGNIGGGGFMLCHVDGESSFLDFRETAPAAARRDMYLDQNGEVIAGLSLVGGLSIGVPGTVRGMQSAHARYGELPWAKLLQPAITLARDGFVVDPGLAELRDEMLSDFAARTNFSDYFTALNAGSRFRQAELAGTLETLAADPESFYTGKIAGQIVAQMARSNGLIDRRDLAHYQIRWREPLRASWQGRGLLSAPLPSSGGIALVQYLTMHEFASAQFRGLAHNSAPYLHLYAEISKRVFADRAVFMGDPDFGEAPAKRLLDRSYLRQRATQIDPMAVSTIDAVNSDHESPDTVHYSILDSAGNAVAVTYTLNYDFGSGVVVEGAGFLLNNEMDDFSAKPGVPNIYGVVGNELNAIEPGKRMLSSMTPTIITDEQGVAMILGSSGGSRIFTTVFQVLMNYYEFGMELEQAVAATRFHHQLPQADLIRYDGERSLPAELRKQLGDYGYRLEPNEWGNIGSVQAIARRADGSLEASADPRQWGAAAVFGMIAPTERSADADAAAVH